LPLILEQNAVDYQHAKFRNSFQGMVLFFLVVFCFSGWSKSVSSEKVWVSHAVRVCSLNGKQVTALASGGKKVFLATGNTVFMVTLDSTCVATDMSAKVKKAVDDEVTDILVDDAHQELWIVLNGNTHAALCYSYNLDQKTCASAFLDHYLDMYTQIEGNPSSPSESSIAVLAYDNRQAILGYFKGDIYLYSFAEATFKHVYKPTSIYNWAMAAAMTKATAFVVTRGDGLIAVDRQTGVAKRFHDLKGSPLSAIAAHQQDLYLATTEIYRAKIADFE